MNVLPSGASPPCPLPEEAVETDLVAAVRRQTTALLYENVGIGQLTSVGVALLLALVGWSRHPVGSPLWLATMGMLAWIRWWMARGFHSGPAPREEVDCRTAPSEWKRRATKTICE